MPLRKLRCQLAFACFFFAIALATAQTKRPATIADGESWRTIVMPQLSRDGKFVAFALTASEGDGVYVVRNLTTSKEWRIVTAGTSPATAAAPSGTRTGPPRPAPTTSTRLAFTADSKLLLCSVAPTKAEIEAAKKDKKDTPRTGLAMIELASGNITRIDGVRGWTLAEDNAAYLVYQREPKPAEPAPMNPANPPKPAAPAKPTGQELVLRNLIDKSERTFEDVGEYTIAKDGKALVYIVSSKTEEKNGVYVALPGNNAAPGTLLAGKGRYQKLTWDENQTQLAFLAAPDEKPATPPPTMTPAPTPTPRWRVHHWQRKSGAVSFAPLTAPQHPLLALVCLTAVQNPMVDAGKAVEVLAAGTPSFRPNWIVSDRGALSFSKDGGKLFLSTAPAPAVDPPPPPGSQRVDLDLWHWKDDYLQPMQKVRAEAEKGRTYRAVLHLKDKKFLQLADETLADVTLAADGNVLLGADDRAYRRLVGRDTFSGFFDYHLVNLTTGERSPLLKKLEGGLNVSPGGKYAASFDGKHWHCLTLATGKSINLTEKIGVAFADEDHDQPGLARPYGPASWVADDAGIILSDRHDLWLIAPDGSNARNLTHDLGRKGNLRFRRVTLDPRERGVRLDKPLLLAADNLQTRDEGFYRLDKDGPPRCLIMSGRSFSVPVKAKDADVYLLSAQSFHEPPDLYISDPDFKEMKKISDANPQIKDLHWGRSELVAFKSADGKPLQGLLVKPANFEPGKKYPMIVYIYERLSQRVHQFTPPRAGTSINPSIYASNGYLVFMPDIAYAVGTPGQSALKCVLPGIQAVVDKGCVDEKAIGIQGHSWGGYQIAYMVTQTQRFKAAVAGAPVSNMVSAYGGIRWGTGLSRQFQYEQTQSRIGGTLWQMPLRYLENSPIFAADKVQTPLLMLHNDQDEAVPWYQGIEYFMALRRLDKEVYLCNYNGEMHGLRKKANMKDWTIRMQEFFDHHLKGAAKPAWMETGISFQERVKRNGPVATPAPFTPPAPTEEEEP